MEHGDGWCVDAPLLSAAHDFAHQLEEGELLGSGFLRLHPGHFLADEFGHVFPRRSHRDDRIDQLRRLRGERREQAVGLNFAELFAAQLAPGANLFQ